MNLIKIFIYFIIFVAIYGVAFYLLGNTLYRINSSGNKVFSIVPLFTEGFIGPLRTLWIMLKTGNFYGFLRWVYILLTSLWSPYAVILLLFLIDYFYVSK